MSIKSKILIGFTVLIIIIISAVSFWAAQSLGVSIDASDILKLESLRNKALKQWKQEQVELDKNTANTLKTLTNLKFSELDKKQQQELIQKIKLAMDFDWLEIFQSGKQFSELKLFRDLATYKNTPTRVTNSGPLSHHAYINSKKQLEGNSLSIIATRKPRLSFLQLPFYVLWDNKGILESQGYSPSYSFLQHIVNSNLTHEIVINDQVYRTRAFKINKDLYFMTGYAALRATISRASINQLMLRLAILEVLGLLILGYFLGKRLFAPLTTLKHGIDQVADGHWNEIPLPSDSTQDSLDEVNSVAHSFNNMVRELSSAQDRLIKVQKELVAKEKMAALGRFSAGIAHEINNPLGTILVSAGLIKDALKNKAKIEDEDIESIIEEVKRCKSIIASLRTYTTKAKANLKKVKFQECFKEIFEKLEKDVNKSFLIINYELLPPGYLMVDKQAIYQVFRNLITNAIEAVEKVDNPLINIDFSMTKEYFSIQVQDNGPGLASPEEQIFEPLVTTKAQGTGLGLAICEQIIEGHKGKITAERTSNEMTEFCILLPKHIENPDKEN
jgi:signal transduction histidine kinase